jgi:D-3-phosphoglycerate dehydrogenase
VLRERVIAGAGLDTFGVEPLPADHPFRTLDNLVVTPHLGYVTEGCYRIFFHDIVEDIAAGSTAIPSASSAAEVGPEALQRSSTAAR